MGPSKLNQALLVRSISPLCLWTVTRHSFYVLFPQDAVALLKQAYTEVPSYDIVIPNLLKHGIAGLPAQCFLTPGKLSRFPFWLLRVTPAMGVVM